MASPIRHTGTVQRVARGVVYVLLEQQSACAACHARRICGVDSGEKIIEVRTAAADRFAAGDSVEVALVRRSMGVASLVLGYVVPLVVLLVALLVSKIAGAADGVAACITLAAVAVYYACLYLLRARMDRKIQFTIIKQE